MQHETALEYLLREIDEQRTTVVDSILTGNMNHEEYRRLVGVIQGLNFGTATIKNLAKRLETDADE